MSIHEDHYKALTEALAWGREETYNNNVHFYHAVNGLIPLIQILVDGLADRAAELKGMDDRRMAYRSEGEAKRMAWLKERETP